MMNLPLRGKRFRMWRPLLVLALLACCSTAALGTNNITGSVRNQSRGEPAAGDAVILVQLDREMHEEARAKTDARGTFTFNVQYPDKPYLVRVVHQGVSYDQQASAGDVLYMQVFDAARRVQGVTGSIEILRTGTTGRDSADHEILVALTGLRDSCNWQQPLSSPGSQPIKGRGRAGV
jgi:hypothetical protein